MVSQFSKMTSISTKPIAKRKITHLRGTLEFQNVASEGSASQHVRIGSQSYHLRQLEALRLMQAREEREVLSDLRSKISEKMLSMT